MRETRRLRDRTPVRRAATAGALVVVAVGPLSACSAASDGIDVSAEGQVSYACALVERVGDEYGGPADWETIVGDAADPGSVAASSAAALLGGLQGGSLAEHPELTEAAADMVSGISRASGEQIEAGIVAMQSACADVPASADDATQDGQAAYACALAASVREEHGAVAEWGDGLTSPAWRAAGATAALVGAANGGAIPGSEDLAESARDVLQSVTLLDDALMQSAIDDFAAACDAR